MQPRFYQFWIFCSVLQVEVSPLLLSVFAITNITILEKDHRDGDITIEFWTVIVHTSN